MKRRTSDDRGFIAAEWVVAVGVLLVPTFLAVLIATRIPAAYSAAQVMATEAARAGAQSADCNSAHTAAEDVVDTMESELHVAQLNPRINTTGTQWSPDGVYVVTVKVNAPTGILGLPSVSVPASFLSATHKEPIDRYRFLDTHTPCP